MVWGRSAPQFVRVWLLRGSDDRDASVVEVRARSARVAATENLLLHESLSRGKVATLLDPALHRSEHHGVEVISLPALATRMSFGAQRVRLPARDVLRMLTWVDVERSGSSGASDVLELGTGHVPGFCTQWPVTVRGWSPEPLGPAVRHATLPANGAGLCRAKRQDANCASVRSTQRAYGSDG